MSGSLDAALEELFQLACKAREEAYAPYSQCRIGTALRAKDGSIFTGSNVENASYGATICSERTAVVKAVSQGHTRFVEIMIVTDATPPWPPCGMCRQVLSEFVGDQELIVHMANLKREVLTSPFSELFPSRFSPDYLLDSTDASHS